MIVGHIVKHLEETQFCVATEVANFHRSADIAAISNEGEVWVIECKISNMKQAVKQLQVQKESANKVFIGTPNRNLKKSTLEMLENEGIGLILTNNDATVQILPHQKRFLPWEPAKDLLISRIRNGS